MLPDTKQFVNIYFITLNFWYQNNFIAKEAEE